MLVPSARNLHWRYSVLRSAFVVCKQRISPGESMAENLDHLLKAMEKIWKKIASRTPINGNFGILFSDDDMGVAEKL
eukprot:3560990-Karenia_brevis.AAC.1